MSPGADSHVLYGGRGMAFLIYLPRTSVRLVTLMSMSFLEDSVHSNQAFFSPA